jgi:ribosomal-protein-alanine N-acetyltransferase
VTDVIRTERLELVPIDVEGANRLVAGDMSGIVAGAGWPHNDTFDGMRMEIENGSSTPCWLVRLDGTVIGELGWKGGPGPDGTAEIGYGLSPAYRGRGYGTEAVTGFVDWASRQPAVRRLVAETRADNMASRRVLEHAGFAITSATGDAVYWERDCAS